MDYASWWSGRLSAVSTPLGKGIDYVHARVEDEGVLVFDDYVELGATRSYCNCNDNVGNLDADCRRDRYQSTLRQAYVVVYYPGSSEP